MKAGLPEGHGLSAALVAGPLLRRSDEGEIELTDIQFEALHAGVAKGESILAVAPTSSGKTDIGMLAAASWLDAGISDGCKVVYLTSHRALARQKFHEFKARLGPLFALAPSEIVLATGDDVVDANSDPVPDAFSAPLIVATYEKYLNMLAGSGFRGGTDKICCIADELQLISDSTRGQQVEILMTLLRQETGQIVGLSAVMEDTYASLLASWLHARLIKTTKREVPLNYELRTPSSVMKTTTDYQSPPLPGPARELDTISTLKELLREPGEHEPIAVFCMSKKEVFELAEQWAAEAAKMGASIEEELPLFREPTTSADELNRYLPHKFAYHTADLNEDERVAVEARLDGNGLRVVFATTTLAAGLNYAFRTVIIHKWERWNSKKRAYEAIPPGEFHNMAGRAGRLSHVDRPGRVIFFAATPIQIRIASRYLSWWELEQFKARIHPSSFPQLSLQLLASGVVESEQQLFDFLQGTFSAQRELEINASQPEHWREALANSLASLREWNFIA
ncbi:DEAD/DEAH box helicase [Agrobacterium leguminum]|uniref:DEAD/DEAH box helicase n=1 Tax=Agrobacterium leguminum TaxID=2792015 RepID=UPI00272A7BE7|nr:DEAD/DEAH box helicase [Agrobacterium leguminum]WLD97003.1 DEAD/DEAH box helicase [Agrobacterium leguminum]